LVHGLVHWFEGIADRGENRGGLDERKLRELAVFLRTKVHPNWRPTVLTPNLLTDAQRSDDDFLDFLDGALQVWNNSAYGKSLSRLLDAGGSAWTASEDGLSLVRVVSDEAQATFDAATLVADEITTERHLTPGSAATLSGDSSSTLRQVNWSSLPKEFH
jgi:hypothetical protein